MYLQQDRVLADAGILGALLGFSTYHWSIEGIFVHPLLLTFLSHIDRD